jgi:N-acetylmuramoyl-L-alanine amidase
MNSSEPTGTGSEVLFDDAKPQNRAAAVALAARYADATGLRNRGAKPDTESHEGNVFLLGRFPGAGFLLETGFITHAGDLEIVRTRAAGAVADILIAQFGARDESGDTAAAHARMRELGVFDETVDAARPLTAGELALFLTRFERAMRA